jgi:hypothetical protein
MNRLIDNFLDLNKKISLDINIKGNFLSKIFILKKTNVLQDIQILYYFDELKIVPLEGRYIFSPTDSTKQILFRLSSIIIDISEKTFNHLKSSEYENLVKIIDLDYISKIKMFFENPIVKKFLEVEEKPEELKEKEIELENEDYKYFEFWNMIFLLIYHLNIPDSLLSVINLNYVIWLLKKIDIEKNKEKMDLLRIISSTTTDLGFTVATMMGGSKSRNHKGSVESLMEEYLKKMGYKDTIKKPSTITEWFNGEYEEADKYSGDPLKDDWFQIKK